MSVYFARREGNGLIKIGWSANVPNRMIALKAKLIGAVPGDEDDEKSLHERFAHLRVKGEWFKPADELLAYIRQEAQTHKPDHETVQTAIRLPATFLERADRIAPRMSKASHLDISVKRSQVLRLAVDKGLKALERKYP